MKPEIFYDLFYREAGTVEKMECSVCLEDMGVIRNCHHGRMINRGFDGGDTKDADEFFCKYAEEDWHIQAKEILRLERDTPSQWLANKLEQERKRIILSKMATKESFQKIFL